MKKLNCLLVGLTVACGTTPPPKPAAPPTIAPATPYENAEKSASDEVREEATVGVGVAVPKAWHRRDITRMGVGTILFSPKKDDGRTRIALLRFPKLFLPKGLETREMQLKAALGARYQRVGVGEALVDGMKARWLRYTAKRKVPSQTVEYFVPRKDAVVVLQYTAPASQRAASRAHFEALLTAAKLIPYVAPKPVVKKAEKAKKEFVTRTRVLAHDIDVLIEPATGAFSATDRLTITAKKEPVETVRLQISKFDELVVRGAKGELEYRVEEHPQSTIYRVLVISLRRPLKKGQRLPLVVRAATKRFRFEFDKSPIGNYHVFGQVTNASSYSSHVYYYPIDDENRAGATVRFDVPEGYVAVGAGKLVSERGRGQRRIFTWREKSSLIKQLPFGWTVAKYDVKRGRTPAGVPIRVYSLAGHGGKAKRVLKVAVDALRLYERRFGRFPFGSVSIAEVTPRRGIAGVSLPGLVLLSEGFFDGADSYAGMETIEKAPKGPQYISDELSHQYNFYGVALPNALAEGMAQYTDTLFAEEVTGKGITDHLAYYSRLYRGAVKGAPDAPIMSKGVYESGAYAPIVFCKGALVLHMLRERIGTKRFYRALRTLFTRYRGKRASVAELQAIAEKVSGKKLGNFFEQWYERPGYPRLALSWRQEGATLKVRVEQRQKGTPFELPLSLVVSGAKGKKKVRALLDAKRKVFSFPIADATAVTLDKERYLLAEVSYAQVAAGH